MFRQREKNAPKFCKNFVNKNVSLLYKVQVRNRVNIYINEKPIYNF
jgi:ribosomal protein L31E